MMRSITAVVTWLSLVMQLVVPACAFQSQQREQQLARRSAATSLSQSPPSPAASFLVLSASASSATSTVESEPATMETTSEIALQDPVILFDGVCNFCNAWVDILLRLDRNGKFKFAPLQSETGRRLLAAVGKEADDISSVVLVQPDLRYFDKSACVLKVVQELGPAAALASNSARALVPPSLRDRIYDTVAENRYNLLGKRDECRCGDPQYADRFLS